MPAPKDINKGHITVATISFEKTLSNDCYHLLSVKQLHLVLHCKNWLTTEWLPWLHTAKTKLLF